VPVSDAFRTRFDALSAQLRYLPRTGRLIWEATRGWSVAWVSILVLLGLSPLATVTLTKRLVDSIVAATRTGGATWTTLRPALLFALLLALITVLSELLQGALEWVRTAQSELIQDHISRLVHTKSVEVDLAFYESPEYFDSLYRARDEAGTRPLALLDNLGGMVQNLVSLLGFAGLIAAYGPVLLIAMILSTLPAIYIVTRYNWLNHDWWHQTTAERRWIQYYDQKFTASANAAELRLFRLGARFQSAYRNLRTKLRVQKLALVRKQSIARMAAALFSVAVGGLSMGWMGWRALRGGGTLGDLVLFYQVLMGSQSLMRAFTGSFGQVYSNSLFLGSLFQFLDLKPSISDPPVPKPAPHALKHGIRFDDVTFHYPGSERQALQNFSVSIPAGKIVAIVGPNGAGKSTLLKLITRFYDPAEGRISIDGIDLRDMGLEDLRQMMSVLFQIPVSYDASASENIAIGDTSHEADPASITCAAISAGAHEIISTLPQGYATPLGKSFAMGNELSAGEWQRIAMARAFLRRSPIILLDEPTSFMDSWAEADWFDRLRSLAEGRTAIVITHRFTIAMRADLIHVLQQGRLIESGTHVELLAVRGSYAASWRQQMQMDSVEEPAIDPAAAAATAAGPHLNSHPARFNSRRARY
jgi:ATP-binding cassette, subfamily B, bacterial